jgi:hypothetical protein
MRLPQTGGCQCGAIRYEVTEAPQLVYTCRLERNRKFVDSPLEGTGFELSVPREIGLGYEALSFICRHKSPCDPPRAPIPRGNLDRD